MAELGQVLLHRRRFRRRQIFVPSGVGGMGKTQLAAEYARRNHRRYGAVFWLDGSSEDSLKQSIVHAATRIPPRQIPKAYRTVAISEGVDTVHRNHKIVQVRIRPLLIWVGVTKCGNFSITFKLPAKRWYHQHIKPRKVPQPK